MTVDLTMPLAPARPNDAHRARDIQPSPDNSHTVAVAVRSVRAFRRSATRCDL